MDQSSHNIRFVTLKTSLFIGNCITHSSPSPTSEWITRSQPFNRTQEPCTYQKCMEQCSSSGYPSGSCVYTSIDPFKTCQCTSSAQADNIRNIGTTSEQRKLRRNEHNVNGTSLNGTVNIAMPNNCLNRRCALDCRGKGFSFGSCADLETCHCYGPNSSPHDSKLEHIPFKTPEVLSHESFLDECKDYCSKKGYKKGFCEGEKCNCYDPKNWMQRDDTNGPLRLWKDLIHDPCQYDHCPNSCQKIGFPKGACADLETCHCYNPNNSSYESTTDTDKIRSKTTAIVPNAFISHYWKGHCSKNGFKNGFCDDETCYCYDPKYWMPQNSTIGPPGPWRDISQESCKHDDCTGKCQKIGFSKGACVLKCTVGGFSHGGCMDDHICHCHEREIRKQLRKIRLILPSTPPRTTNNTAKLIPTNITTTPRTNITTSLAPRNWLLDISTVINVPVCITTKCRSLCKKASFKKGHCENDEKCVCYQKSVNSIPRKNRGLRMLPK